MPRSSKQQRPNAAGVFRQTYGDAPAYVASAPGRIEFVGNHTDYNGGLVLGAAVDRHVEAALRRRPAGGRVRLRSGGGPLVEVELDRIAPQEGAGAWANYPLGVLAELRRAGAEIREGFDLGIASDLPAGAGLSSSAALELSTAYALAAAYDFPLSPEQAARLCRRAENRFVGVPCGILDQGVSAFGRQNHLVLVDAARETFRHVPLPEQSAFWIFNTHTAHTLADSLYAERHAACREALTRLQAFHPGARHLADLTPDQVEHHRQDLPDRLYRRARHVTAEHARVGAVAAALRAGDLAAVGRLLFASHESSRTLFENSTEELDFLVAHLAGTPHVHGARLTGGGFGGAVMAFTDPAFSPAEAESVAQAYRSAFGRQPSFLCCRTAEGAGLREGSL